MVGFERNRTSGEMGTSSYGNTRIWRVTHDKVIKNDMMRESRQLWDEWEREAGLETPEQKIVKPGGIINFGSTKNRYLREVIE